MPKLTSSPSSPLSGKLLLVGALVTLLLIVARDFLPQKKWHWMAAKNVEHSIYADDIFGGASYAERASTDGIHLRCNLIDAGSVIPFCGFNAVLDNSNRPALVDLRDFDKIHVRLEYSGGNQKLRFYIREFVEGYSDPANPIETAKYMSVYIPAEATGEEIVIDMEEFTVADWWVNENNVPREFALPSRMNVVVFGVDVAYPAALGKHELKLKEAYFVGDWISAENWYLGILIAWVTALGVAGGVQLFQFRRLTMELKREKDEYRELSKIDHLTQLANRHGLNQRAAELATRRSGGPVAVLFIDIDHFKPINDTYGHNVGDKVLCQVAQSIAKLSRQADIAARWGGEEFVVLMPDTDVYEATVVAERLRQNVRELKHADMPDAQVTISIGATVWRAGETLEAALARGDAALYQAKQQGRDRLVSDTNTPPK